MNKSELIDAIAGTTRAKKKDIEAIVGALTDVITKTVSNGEKVMLVGFGTFEKRARQEREGRNPKTGESMTIAATSVPAFSAGKNFKGLVAGE